MTWKVLQNEILEATNYENQTRRHLHTAIYLKYRIYNYPLMVVSHGAVCSAASSYIQQYVWWLVRTPSSS